MHSVGFEPTRTNTFELESNPLDRSGKNAWFTWIFKKSSYLYTLIYLSKNFHDYWQRERMCLIFPAETIIVVIVIISRSNHRGPPSSVTYRNDDMGYHSTETDTRTFYTINLLVVSKYSLQIAQF